MKNFIKSVARTLLHKGGALQDVRYWNRDAFRILMYHDFPASVAGLQESFDRQCAHITSCYQVVSLTDIDRSLREGRRLPPNALAVTVDDGNRDFLLSGYPVFHAHKIPVTVFLVSGFLDRKLWLWWDQISYAVEESRRSFFEMALSAGQPPVRFALETAEQRRQAIAAITTAVKSLGVEERLQVLNGHLSKLLEVEIPQEPPPRLAALEWPEVRRLAENGVDFGAHTVTHPVLSSIRDPRELLREIGDSKRRIEEELRRPVLHFCYPYGCWEDFNEEAVKVVEQCGFHTAVTAEPGLNFRGAHPFKLKRIPSEPTTSEPYFQESLAGLHLRSDDRDSR